MWRWTRTLLSPHASASYPPVPTPPAFANQAGCAFSRSRRPPEPAVCTPQPAAARPARSASAKFNSRSPATHAPRNMSPGPCPPPPPPVWVGGGVHGGAGEGGWGGGGGGPGVSRNRGRGRQREAPCLPRTRAAPPPSSPGNSPSIDSSVAHLDRCRVWAGPPALTAPPALSSDALPPPGPMDVTPRFFLLCISGPLWFLGARRLPSRTTRP